MPAAALHHQRPVLIAITSAAAAAAVLLHQALQARSSGARHQGHRLWERYIWGRIPQRCGECVKLRLCDGCAAITDGSRLLTAD